MASRRCGMRGNRQLPPGFADQALERIRRVMLISRSDSGVEELHGPFLGKKLSGASWCGLAYGFP